MIHALMALLQALTLIMLTPILVGALFYIIKYKTDVSVIMRYGLALIIGLSLLYFSFDSNTPLLIIAIFVLSLPTSVGFILFVRHTINLERRDLQ